MSKFKYIILGMLLGMFIPCTAVFAQSQIKLIVNGKEIQSDVAPQTINGRTMVPARALAEALGATVAWDAQENAITITSNGVKQVSNAQVVKQAANEALPTSLSTIPLGYVETTPEIVKTLSAKGYTLEGSDDYTFYYLRKSNYPLPVEICHIRRGEHEYRGYMLKSDYDTYIAPIIHN